MKKVDRMSAEQAAKQLGVSIATIYSYVSRGLIRAEKGADARSSFYRTEDIRALKEKKEFRKNPGKAAESALHLGFPVMESSISLILNNRLFYKGYDVATLVAKHSIEEVAALIWTGDIAEPFSAPGKLEMSQRWKDVYKMVSNMRAIEAFQTLIPLAAAEDPAAYDLRTANVIKTAARILSIMALIGAKTSMKEYNSNPGIANLLARNLSKIPLNESTRLINAALILSADHELNVSAFTSRCVASAGSTPYAAVSAGLAALQGYKHGGYCDRVEALFSEAAIAKKVREVIVNRFRRGEELPGFGHNLYPNGDPRGAILLDLARETGGHRQESDLANVIAKTVFDISGERPTIDFGLVSIARKLKFPPGNAIALFAIGRTVGWIGHAIEQYKMDSLIRPRAKYVGPPPR